MRIIVNGESVDLEKTINIKNIVTLLDLVHHYGLNLDNIIVEHNRILFKKDSLHTVKLQNGDEVEFLHFMGGG